MIGASVSAGFLSHAEGRRAVISCDAFHMGLQDKHTPWPLTEQMVDRVAEELPDAQTILVLFNLEFIEVINARCPAELSKVTFIADSPMEKLFAEVVYKVRALYLKSESWTEKVAGGKVTEATWRKLMKMNGAADVTLTNPSYNGGLDLKILIAMNDAGLLRRVVCVHPSTWLVDVKTQLGPKTGNPLFRKFQGMVGPHLKSVHLFNGNPVFGIGLFVPCVITDMDMGWTREHTDWVSAHFVDDPDGVYHKVTGLADITLHGVAWRSCVKEFFQHMQVACKNKGSLGGGYKTGARATSQYPVQLANIRGHVNLANIRGQVKEDFYTMVQCNPSANKGIRSSNPRQLIYEFSTPEEQENFLGYLQTDFARLALSLTKTNQDLDQGQLDMVPWLDFTRSWNDDQLFSEFGYPPGHPLREYAKRFLPDYHNIYPNGKTY